MASNRKSKQKDQSVVGFIGVGLDSDGEYRVTKSEHFFLVGGSQNTHEHMQNTAIKFTEKLREEGTPLHETPLEIVVEIEINDER